MATLRTTRTSTRTSPRTPPTKTRRRRSKSPTRRSKAQRKRGDVRIHVKKGGLPGYHMKDPNKTRLVAIIGAIRVDGYTTVERRLLALAVFNKRKNPTYAAIAYRDAMWVAAQREAVRKALGMSKRQRK